MSRPRRFTETEEKLIRALAEAGWTGSAIARLLNTSPTTIRKAIDSDYRKRQQESAKAAWAKRGLEYAERQRAKKYGWNAGAEAM